VGGTARQQAMDVKALIAGLEAQQEEIQARIDKMTSQLLASKEYKLASLPDDPMTRLIDQYSQEVLQLEEQLEREQARKQQLTSARDLAWETYQTLARKAAEVGVASQVKETEVRFAMPAVEPERPTKPNKMLNTLLASVVGAMLAVGAAFLIEYLDDTVKTSEELNQALGVTALGVISRMPPTEKEPDWLITAAHPKSHIAEAYRVLRTNLQFASVTRPLRSILVTSANPSVGKSTTVANLGVVLAQAGKRVILVDSDLRRPSLHKIFEVPNTAGLTNLLLQDEPCLDGHMADTRIENLKVIPSGPLPPNPSELLGSQRMKHLVEVLKEEADIVLFDSPPILPVADAAVLSTVTDGVMLVVEAGSTRRDVLAQARAALAQAGAYLVGAALNKLRPSRGSGYYYYYYYTPEGERKRRKRERGDMEGIVSRLPWLDRLLRRTS